MRRKIGLVILGLFLLIDALAWVATYRAASVPSPEELQLQAGAYDVQVELHDAQGRELGRNGFAFAIEPPEEEKEEEEEK
jgi:hypothetical protein